MERSPYKVKNDKVLHARVGLVVVVGSSIGRESVVPSPPTRGPLDTPEQFTRFNWAQDRLAALHVRLILMIK